MRSCLEVRFTSLQCYPQIRIYVSSSSEITLTILVGLTKSIASSTPSTQQDFLFCVTEESRLTSSPVHRFERGVCFRSTVNFRICMPPLPTFPNTGLLALLKPTTAFSLYLSSSFTLPSTATWQLIQLSSILNCYDHGHLKHSSQ